MLVYLKTIERGTARTKAIPIESIKCVGQVQPVSKEKSRFFFSITLDGGELVSSKHFDTKEEAEMTQLSTISLINAVEIFFYRIKNDLDLNNIYFHWVNVAERKLVLSKLPTDIQLFTVEI